MASALQHGPMHAFIMRSPPHELCMLLFQSFDCAGVSITAVPQAVPFWPRSLCRLAAFGTCIQVVSDGLQEVQLATVITALGKLQLYNEPFTAALLARAKQLAPQMSAHAASQMLCGMSALRHRDDRSAAALAAAMTRHVAAASSGNARSAQRSQQQAPGAQEVSPLAQPHRRERGRLAAAPTAGSVRVAYPATARKPSAPLSTAKGIDLTHSVAGAAFACARLGGSDNEAVRQMIQAALAFISQHAHACTPQTLTNMAWAAAVSGNHCEAQHMAPLVRHVLSIGDQLHTVEIAQMAQVDLALQLDADWYTGNEWLADTDHASMFKALYWLGATKAGRCAR